MEVEINREPTNSSQKVSCPHCNKKYLIRLSDLHHEANQFVCKQCKEEFWIHRSDFEGSQEEVIPQKAEEYAIHQTEKCPKCGHMVDSLEKPCPTCGVVGTKFLALRDDTPYLRVSDSLKTLWKRVLNHYDDEPVHHEFLSQALKENQLRYASLQYKQLKETVGEDKIVLEMMRKIQNLTQMKMDGEASKSKAPEYPEYVKFLRWEFFLFAIGGFLVISGLASPMMKNLISLGVVFLALPFLIRIFLRKG